MNADLKAAAVAGDLKMLYRLIEIDPYVLENINKVRFVHTPLHIAAAAGHIRFAAEIIRLMPSFVRRLNEQGLCPMHLALQNIDMVRGFLCFDRDLVRVRGRKGLTSLHFAAKTGQTDILAELLFVCPDSIEDLTVKGETALHIAVRKRHFEALQILVKWLQRYCSPQFRFGILNRKNDSGDTVLHLSARMNNAQTVKFLIKMMNLNAKNSEGSTALDIVEMPQFANADIKNMLLGAKAKRGSNITDTPSFAERLNSKLTISEIFAIMEILCLRISKIGDTTRGALLVVAVLIATVTYQSALSPPGGVIPADSTDSTSSDLNSTISLNNSTQEDYYWGTSVMPNNVFWSFWFCNTVNFLVSITAIYLLLPGKMRNFPVMMAFVFFWISYLAAMFTISPSDALTDLNDLLASGTAIIIILFMVLDMIRMGIFSPIFDKLINALGRRSILALINSGEA